jgi:hypothetical protein
MRTDNNLLQEQIRAMYAFHYQFSVERNEVETEAREGNQKLRGFIKSIPPWTHHYSRPEHDVINDFLQPQGYSRRVYAANIANHRAEALIQVMGEMVTGDYDEEIYQSFDNLTDKEQLRSFSLLMAVLGNIDGLARYQQTIHNLLKQAPESDSALLKAVAVDRTVVADKRVLQRISFAQVSSDESFMNQLAKSITRTIPRRKPQLDDVRIMIEMIDDAFKLKNLTRPQLVHSLIDDLELYPSGIDNAESLKKLIQERNKLRGNENRL